MAPYDSFHDDTAARPRIELRFVPRSDAGRSLAFPCNAAGHVELDRLSELERIDYLYARALRGRDFSCTVVRSA